MKNDSKDSTGLRTKKAVGAGWDSLEKKKNPPRSWSIGIGGPVEGTPIPGHSDLPFQEIKIEKIVPGPQQPRRVFSQKSLDDLAKSISEVGLLEPILVRRAEPAGTFELMAGERRLRACKSLKHTTIKAIVMEVSDLVAYKISMTENILREQLNPIEKALAFRDLLSKKIFPSQSEMASQLGISRTNIVKTLRLLERLHEDAIHFYLENYDHLSEGHLHAAMRAPLANQKNVLGKIKAESWSVQQTRQHVTDTFFPSQRSNHVDLKEKRNDWFDLGIHVRPTIKKADLQQVISTLKQTIQKLEALSKTKT